MGELIAPPLARLAGIKKVNLQNFDDTCVLCGDPVDLDLTEAVRHRKGANRQSGAKRVRRIKSQLWRVGTIRFQGGTRSRKSLSEDRRRHESHVFIFSSPKVLDQSPEGSLRYRPDFQG